jgi:hypothetical protein
MFPVKSINKYINNKRCIILDYFRNYFQKALTHIMENEEKAHYSNNASNF